MYKILRKDTYSYEKPVNFKEQTKARCIFAKIRVMSKILLKDIRIFTNHGCLVEEEKIGSDYLVDLLVEADLGASAHSDDLEDTIDYVSLNNIVKEEMAIRARLLETVGYKIIERVLATFPEVSYSEVTISKMNPPIGGDVKSVSVTMTSA